jgi:hypothetical protein
MSDNLLPDQRTTQSSCGRPGTERSINLFGDALRDELDPEFKA